MSGLIGLLMCLVGHFWPCIVFGTLFGLFSDWICSRGGYKALAWNTLGYIVLILGLSLDSYSPMLFFESTFRQTRLNMGMDSGIIEQMLNIIHGPLVLAAFAGSAVCAVIGALIGKALLKKHFVKAGIL
jgi:energy-coupling factor transport system substrate-specific component